MFPRVFLPALLGKPAVAPFFNGLLSPGPCQPTNSNGIILAEAPTAHGVCLLLPGHGPGLLFRLGHEAVAGVADGEEVAGLGGVRLECLS